MIRAQTVSWAQQRNNAHLITTKIVNIRNVVVCSMFHLVSHDRFGRNKLGNVSQWYLRMTRRFSARLAWDDTAMIQNRLRYNNVAIDFHNNSHNNMHFIFLSMNVCISNYQKRHDKIILNDLFTDCYCKSGVGSSRHEMIFDITPNDLTHMINKSPCLLQKWNRGF